MTAFAQGPHQVAVLQLLRDGRGRTARQIATKLDHPHPSTSTRLKRMAEAWPTLVHSLPAKPPQRGRIWKLTPTGREYLTRLDTP